MTEYAVQYGRCLSPARYTTADDDTFKAALASAADKPLAHQVYADWLDEQGRPDEAARHRLKGRWPGMLAPVWHALRHGSVRDEWAAWEAFAADLAAHGDTPVTGYRTSQGDHTRTAAEVAAGIRAAVAEERRRTEAAGGRRGRAESTLYVVHRNDPANPAGVGFDVGDGAGVYDRPGEAAA